MEANIDICELLGSSENDFYYTQDTQIRKIDDIFILSKLSEKYPDLDQRQSESILKQVIVTIANDGKLVSEIETLYGVNPMDLFIILYRNFEFVFNKCLMAKIQKTIKNKTYVKRIKRPSRRSRRT